MVRCNRQRVTDTEQQTDACLRMAQGSPHAAKRRPPRRDAGTAWRLGRRLLQGTKLARLPVITKVAGVTEDDDEHALSCLAAGLPMG